MADMSILLLESLALGRISDTTLAEDRFLRLDAPFLLSPQLDESNTQNRMPYCSILPC